MITPRTASQVLAGDAVGVQAASPTIEDKPSDVKGQTSLFKARCSKTVSPVPVSPTQSTCLPAHSRARVMCVYRTVSLVGTMIWEKGMSGLTVKAGTVDIQSTQALTSLLQHQS